MSSQRAGRHEVVFSTGQIARLISSWIKVPSSSEKTATAAAGCNEERRNEWGEYLSTEKYLSAPRAAHSPLPAGLPARLPAQQLTINQKHQQIHTDISDTEQDSVQEDKVELQMEPFILLQF